MTDQPEPDRDDGASQLALALQRVERELATVDPEASCARFASAI